jgi:hypothetical protein
MKVAEGMSFYGLGYRLKAGDEVPEELLAQLPEGHPLKPKSSVQPAPRTHRATEER